MLGEIPDLAQREFGGPSAACGKTPEASAQPPRFNDSPLRETVSCAALVKKLHLKATAPFS